MRKYLSQIVLIAVLTAAASFFAGMKYGQSRWAKGWFPFAASRQMLFDRQGGGYGRLNNGRTGKSMLSRPVAGEIIKVDGQTMTVKQPDGTSRIVVLTETTEIGEMTEVSTDKLTVGSTVSVFGIVNDDGSVTAQSIRLNPVFRGQK